MSYDRPGKNWARPVLFQGIGPVGSVMTMPCRDRHCVRVLTQMGVIHDDTRQVWIECDPEVADHLGSFAFEQRATVINTTLERYSPQMGFDLMNADTEASFGAAQALAFERNLGHRINPGGHLILWFTEWARNGQANEFRDWIEQQPEIIATRTAIDAMIDAGAFSGMDGSYSQNTRDSLTLALAMLDCAMHQYEFDTVAMVRYNDGMPMIACRFSGLRERSDDEPVTPFSVIYQRYQNEMVPPITDEDRAAMERVSIVSQGTHRVDRNGSMWALVVCATGKTIIERANLGSITRYYD